MFLGIFNAFREAQYPCEAFQKASRAAVGNGIATRDQEQGIAARAVLLIAFLKEFLLEFR